MTICPDSWIAEHATSGMITPFEPKLIRKVLDEIAPNVVVPRPVISYGASSYGYDLRLSPADFKVFRHIPGTVVDPKAFNPANLEEATLQHDDHGSFFILPAHSYGLGVTIEHLAIPTNVTILFLGKSTYARCGLIVNLTPGEAGWCGHLTLEFSNSAPADVRIYANEGVTQAIFFEGTPCDTSYKTRSGKYQNQGPNVTLARV